MSIIDFDHINIRTANVAAMTSFYTEVLGLEEGWRPDFSFPGAWLYLADRPLIHLRGVDITPGASEVRIEHFAFRANGLNVFLTALRERRLAYNVNVSPSNNNRMVNVYDPDNNHVEIQFDASETSDLSAYTPT